MRPADAGWCVLNVAVGKALPANLPPTHTTRNPSGGFLLRYTTDCTDFACDELELGIDAPDYVILPPTPGYAVIDNREPVPLPHWVVERLGGADPEDDLDFQRFTIRNASEGEELRPITYWDEDKLLPRINCEGCVGYIIGASGSHKTGLALMLALDAIERHGAKVLYIATEGGRGVENARMPAARKAREMSLGKLDAHWRVLNDTFNLLNAGHRAGLVHQLRRFPRDIIITDVMTLAAPGADINVQKDAIAISDAAADFGAEVRGHGHPNPPPKPARTERRRFRL